MSDATNPDSDSGPEDSGAARPGGCSRVVVLGCGSMFLLVVVGGVLAFLGRTTLAVHATRFLLARQIQGTAFPDDQKQAIIGHLDRLVAGCRDGRVEPERVAPAFEQISAGVALRCDVLFLFLDRYVAQSGLASEQKSTARSTVGRIARGIFEGKIPEVVLGDIAGRMRRESGTQRLGIPDQELREFLAQLADRADAAGIPDEPFVLDAAARIGKVVDLALGQK